MMADKRLNDFPAKTLPSGSDISYIGDSLDQFRENKSTIDEINSYQGSIEITSSGQVSVNQSFFGKNIVCNNPAPLSLTLPQSAVFRAGSQFHILRNSPSEVNVISDIGVTINGVDSETITLVSQYDRVVLTLISNNEWSANNYGSDNVDPTFQSIYDNDATANINISAGKPFELTSASSQAAFNLKSTSNTSETASLGLITSLPVATPGSESSDWFITGLKQGVETPAIVWEGVIGRLSLIGNNPGFVSITGTNSGFNFTCDQGDIGDVVGRLGFSGVNASNTGRGYGQIETVIQSNGGIVDGKMIFSVSERNFGGISTTTPYFEIDGLSKTIRSFKPFENFNMTDAEFKAVDTPAKGLSAFITDSDRIEINKGTSVAPLYDQIAYLSDIPEAGTPGYGEMHFTENVVETNIVGPQTPVKVSGNYLSDPSLLLEFTHNNGVLTYTGETANFKIDSMISCSLDLFVGTVSIFVFKNGAAISKVKQQQSLGPASPSLANISAIALETLNPGDQIEVRVQNDSSTDNITVTQLYCIPHKLTSSSSGGSSTVTTLQEAFDAQANGAILLPSSGKDFVIQRATILSDVLRVSNSSVKIDEQTTVFSGGTTSPFELTNNKVSSPGQSIKMLVNDARNPSLSAGTVYDMQVQGINSSATPYDIFGLNVFKTNIQNNLERSRITYTSTHDGLEKELLKFDGDSETVYFGDPIVIKSLTDAEISSRVNIPTELKYNSTSDNFQYTDLTNTERKIAISDSGVASLTFGTPIGVVGGSAGINVSKQFYVKTGNIVNIKCRIDFTVNSDVIRLQVNLPFSPQFTATDQATGVGTMQIDSDITANDGSKLASTSSQVVLNDSLRLDLFAVNTSASYVLDVDIMYEIQ